MGVSESWDLNEKKVEELLYLLVLGVLEVKDGLDKTGMKKQIKTAKTACSGMWSPMHSLDLQRSYVFWTAGITTVVSLPEIL